MNIAGKRAFSEEHKKKLSISQLGNKKFLGKHHNEETRKKISKAKIGIKNPMYGIGDRHPFYGKHHTEEAKEKNKLAHIGKPAWNRGKCNIYSKDILEKMKLKKIGNHYSIKTEFKKGNESWNKGLTKFEHPSLMKYSERLKKENPMFNEKIRKRSIKKVKEYFLNESEESKKNRGEKISIYFQEHPELKSKISKTIKKSIKDNLS